jgi:hypothetical protein
MEDQNYQNDEIQLTQNIILENLKYHLNNIARIFKNCSSLNKMKALLEIKSFSDMRKTNKIKADYIFLQLITSVKTILKFYKQKELIKYFKFFTKWKNIANLVKSLENYKQEIEILYEKKMENECIQLENCIHEKEKTNNELKILLNKQEELETELLKKIKTLEEKKVTYTNQISKLEEDKKVVFEEMNLISRNASSENQNLLKEKVINYNYFFNKIREYEQQIVSIKEENKEKDASINIFLREMNELLQAHEKNSIQ